jgi:hypothetical protein
MQTTDFLLPPSIIHVEAMQEVTATTFAKAAKLAGTSSRAAKSRHAATFGNPIQGAGLISVN